MALSCTSVIVKKLQQKIVNTGLSSLKGVNLTDQHNGKTKYLNALKPYEECREN